MSTVDTYGQADSSDHVVRRGRGTGHHTVEVRRNAGLAAVIGGAGSAIAIAWLGRAAQSGAALDWIMVAATAGIGVVWLRAFVDARTPLLVADEQGVRVRFGGAWHGLPWADLDRVEHHPRRNLWRDGRLVLVAHDQEARLADLDGPGRRTAWVNARLLGAPYAVPLGLSTRIPDASGDLTATLRRLAAGQTAVVEPALLDHLRVTEETEAAPDLDEPTELDAVATSGSVFDHRVDDFASDEAGADTVAGVVGSDDADLGDDQGEPGVVARAALFLRSRVARFLDGHRDQLVVEEARNEPSRNLNTDDLDTGEIPVVGLEPVRELRTARRSEVHSEMVPDQDALQTVEGRELRRHGSVNLVEETQVLGDRTGFGEAVAASRLTDDPMIGEALIDDLAAAPAPDPVIGPELAEARNRIGLSVDALAERTRIRPHVIESIEVDDFGPCGGDFYARGHLRTLARVLGVDAGPLLTAYDERYSDAPINARRVFEAELATGAGGIRSTRGGPNWSIMVAAVMAVILAWSVARLVMDDAKDPQNPAISLSQGSGGPNRGGATTQRVTIKVTASSSTDLTVTNAKGKVVFTGEVTAGDIHRIDVVPPVKVRASDAGAVAVEIDGDPRGALGASGQPGSKTYRVAR